MPTAADVRQATDRDTVVLTGAVLVGIFVILMFLLRSLVAPVYLILTILLSYLTTLGMTTIAFQNIAGKAGLAWAVPLFSFIMLVALGEDYNIFLMSRIKEETAEKGRVAGVVRAVERTGGIITSCGIILAGTFGVMMISQMAEVKEIGFAICFGIILDTFIVRSVMVPSLVTLIGRWSWWPRRMPEAEPEGEAI
jgi:RND superfamily putative drug exporter